MRWAARQPHRRLGSLLHALDLQGMQLFFSCEPLGAAGTSASRLDSVVVSRYLAVAAPRHPLGLFIHPWCPDPAEGRSVADQFVSAIRNARSLAEH